MTVGQVSERPAALELSDFEPPAQPSAFASADGPSITPRQRIHFYSPEEWEQFVLEWVLGLTEPYVQVKRLGGTGDGGIDVAAFKTEHGLEGTWHCFQCKHYATPLTPADAYAEILKLFRHVHAGDYVLPDVYGFLAPQGCGSTLSRLLSRPTELKARFLEKVAVGQPLAERLDTDEATAVRALAASTDFAVFRTVEMHEVLETHRKTPYHQARFGGCLRTRPDPGEPPEALAPEEARYVEQLREVYAEAGAVCAPDELHQHPAYGEHFRRQRIRFYSAEALRVYARDAVPEGTFERMQNDIHIGVVETAESQHASGLDRLRSVIELAGQPDLSAHVLVAVSTVRDKQGICHQLANENRLTWLRSES